MNPTTELSCAALAAGQRPGRAPEGIVAVLLPFTEEGRPDLDGLLRQMERILALGLRPAVNMDTGYAQLLSPGVRTEILGIAARLAGGRGLVAGAHVQPGDGALADRYRRAADEIFAAGGTPILFPCPELRALDEAAIVDLHRRVTHERSGVLLFELGEMFVPYGRIYGVETFGALMQLPGVAGLKHSSLDRRAEWQRLALRDRLRPDFRVYTGNDLAIDMIMWGSDYLLGLAAFHPEAFAARDRLWAAGDARFFAVNDLLQYLGAFAFRQPVPAYRHDAALFLKLRGLIACDHPPAGVPRRPEADREVLAELLQRLEQVIQP